MWQSSALVSPTKTLKDDDIEAIEVPREDADLRSEEDQVLWARSKPKNPTSRKNPRT